ncbi:MAG: ribosome silencing factor [Bacteroidota bacterium]
MAKRRKADPVEKLTQAIVRGMQEKKAQDIVIMDLRSVRNAVADFFVICSGTSDKQLAAIIDSVEEETLKAEGQDPWHKEGKQNKEWMLLDYFDVVAHVFRKDKRGFYALEKLWGDAEITTVEDEPTTTDKKKNERKAEKK